MEKVYTVTEIAKLLKISRITLLREIEKGAIEATKAGNAWRITETSYNKYIGVKNEK